MVISTGKLYHHKMKMLRLQPDSDTKEMLKYLQSRHSLYLQGNCQLTQVEGNTPSITLQT